MDVKIEEIQFNRDGLVPAIVQESKTKEVLMLAYMNEASLRKTIETKKTWFWSRSRGQLWNKGESSGHFQHVKSIKYDCDGDTLLVEVDQVGVACHTGEKNCFFKDLMKADEEKNIDITILEKVYNVIKDRKENPKEGSYTNYLFEKGIDKILKKVGEENAEVIIAAKNPEKEELVYEASDLMYHLFVLLNEREIPLEEIYKELAKRTK
ncbi:bifunctional phosphoribosyl-AMP cyclohydrolase/phosphoribosyl-ATP diphosphatase HisIE [Serpentinicella sp. ANB-PHB4]|uniref:bifunctional phosphoribosyl-AMP cyclohydrolase/phosphoribosyl-ATP diphosphatase HisIE n=1 Tax=Serpentinicella sp. ANB-PHB4 TaxID=3074076 RepID=UPI00285551F4|nr:bifunctional phosphoribosyl-AMP cyclohydrolase/phosphoribosyl-ATP diphosphatase HisIE [Serpentinicella sp. ANB-PHB4]MDR5659750.1 bifunctional phosphoribosyl-AMP cyclohydrolase/phosphoribosyl-ATP diphosphatase HisIE [Serpentinicella sp. ANB-PHB4]